MLGRVGTFFRGLTGETVRTEHGRAADPAADPLASLRKLLGSSGKGLIPAFTEAINELPLARVPEIVSFDAVKHWGALFRNAERADRDVQLWCFRQLLNAFVVAHDALKAGDPPFPGLPGRISVNPLLDPGHVHRTLQRAAADLELLQPGFCAQMSPWMTRLVIEPAEDGVAGATGVPGHIVLHHDVPITSDVSKADLVRAERLGFAVALRHEVKHQQVLYELGAGAVALGQQPAAKHLQELRTKHWVLRHPAVGEASPLGVWTELAAYVDTVEANAAALRLPELASVSRWCERDLREATKVVEELLARLQRRECSPIWALVPESIESCRQRFSDAISQGR